MRKVSNTTIVSHRSAISIFHDPIEGREIDDNPRVSNLMSEIFNQIPRQQKPILIWDFDVVLQYFRNLPENNLLSGKTEALKLAFLLSLTLASRASEITNLS